MVGSATLIHDIPDGPPVVSPEGGAVLDPDEVAITWDAVTSPSGIQIVGYQANVEREDPLGVYRIDLPAAATTVALPP